MKFVRWIEVFLKFTTISNISTQISQNDVYQAFPKFSCISKIMALIFQYRVFYSRDRISLRHCSYRHTVFPEVFKRDRSYNFHFPTLLESRYLLQKFYSYSRRSLGFQHPMPHERVFSRSQFDWNDIIMDSTNRKCECGSSPITRNKKKTVNDYECFLSGRKLRRRHRYTPPSSELAKKPTHVTVNLRQDFPCNNTAFRYFRLSIEILTEKYDVILRNRNHNFRKTLKKLIPGLRFHSHHRIRPTTRPSGAETQNLRSWTESRSYVHGTKWEPRSWQG